MRLFSFVWIAELGQMGSEERTPGKNDGGVKEPTTHPLKLFQGAILPDFCPQYIFKIAHLCPCISLLFWERVRQSSYCPAATWLLTFSLGAGAGCWVCYAAEALLRTFGIQYISTLRKPQIASNRELRGLWLFLFFIFVLTGGKCTFKAVSTAKDCRSGLLSTSEALRPFQPSSKAQAFIQNLSSL